MTTDWNTAASDWGVSGFRQLRDVHNLLPTPNTMDDLPARKPETLDRSKGGYANVRETVVNLLRTPAASEAERGHQPPDKARARGGQVTLEGQARFDDWGQFADAIARWEAVLDLPAPSPTEEYPNGKRLSPLFTEWMMGLRPGWITGRGLSRKDELKMCGNGVVPQQAKLALRILLERID